MYRKALSAGGILVLAVATLLLTPGMSQAQRGGARIGGARVGSAGYGGARVGTFRGTANYGRYQPAFHNYGYYHYPYTGYGYRPYYGSYGYLPYYYGSYPYDSNYSSSYGAVPSYFGDSAYQSYYTPPAEFADTKAHIFVTLPANAELWFDDAPTKATGTTRHFESPPLAPGQHGYELRARWSENGTDVTQSKRIDVAPGAVIRVGFPLPSAK
jgi:uncharacterized protein (TIGR03000 family)